MIGALFVAKTGLAAQDTSLSTISNNLANVSTIGFKKDRAIFEDLLYQVQRQPGAQSTQDTQLPSGLQLGTGVRTVGTQKVQTQGSLQITDGQLDMAINGRGFFQITLADGSTAYTRDGQFQIDSNGLVVNSNGLALSPAITVPANTLRITIGENGTVQAQQDGQSTLTTIGNIQTADFVNPAGLLAIGGNLFRETTSSGTPQTGTPGASGFGAVLQNTLENSNVSVVEELVNLIQTQRAFEVNSKVISNVDDTLRFLNQQT